MCQRVDPFDVELYMGRWYDLLHYPTFFQGNDTYNTTADYTLNLDGTVDVLNTTIINDKEVSSRGIAHSLGGRVFHVDFPENEVAKYIPSSASLPKMDRANYVIHQLWYGKNKGSYRFAVVTNAENTSLWVLSRNPHPSRENYAKLMAYVSKHFDVKKVVATPHYT